jgi:hypothetical protein
MRRYDLSIPEEVNRRLCDHSSALFFCSSQTYADNLRREGIDYGVHVTGDVTFDSFKLFQKAKQFPDGVDPNGTFALCTIHRPINTDTKERLSAALDCLAACKIQVVLPIHPRTRNAIARYGLSLPENVLTLPPVSYFEMLGLLPIPVVCKKTRYSLAKRVCFWPPGHHGVSSQKPAFYVKSMSTRQMCLMRWIGRWSRLTTRLSLMETVRHLRKSETSLSTIFNCIDTNPQNCPLRDPILEP